MDKSLDVLLDKPLRVCPVRNMACLQPNGLAIKNNQQIITFKQLDRLVNITATDLLA